MSISLEELADREEIRQAIYRHFRAADRLDADLARTAFWDDGRFDGGPLEGPASEILPKMYGEMVAEFFSVTNHYMMNMVIEVEGDSAAVETYAIAYHVVPGDVEKLTAVFGPAKVAELGDAASQPHELIMGIRYSVRMEQRAGVWKIALMKLILDWNQVTPYTGIREGGVYGFLHHRGKRDRTDPSYLLLS